MADITLERRITLRLMAYWEKQRGQRAMPCEADIRRSDIEDLWDCCFILRVTDPHKEVYDYDYLGQTIIDAYSFGSPENAVKSMVAPDARRLGSGLGRVLASGKPLLEEGEFRNLRNERVLFRECLLPLGDGDTITSILGGMHFRVEAAN